MLYESPYRLLKCLEEIKTFIGEVRKVCVVREISKIHEQYHFGSASDLRTWFEKHPEKVKGEMVVLISAEVSGKHLQDEGQDE